VPIADVSYRHYDGPLRAHPLRWWIIARSLIRGTLGRWWFWALTALALTPYLVSGFMLYLRSQVPPEAQALLAQRPISGLFYDAFHYSLFWIFLLALLVGASSIAADNRANALQIYLAKPLTRVDYLAGKWGGVFLLLGGAMLAPALVLYLYCLASFYNEGFLRDYRYLLLQVLGAAALAAGLHSSLMVGFSAWTRRPLLAGGLYAGLYVGVGVVASVVYFILSGAGQPEVANTVAHLSVPGLLRGIAQHLFDATPTFFGVPVNGPRGDEVGKPALLPLLAVAFGSAATGLLAALARIRAVEVVRG
jgi:ABC-2 type transport system permease protein